MYLLLHSYLKDSTTNIFIQHSQKELCNKCANTFTISVIMQIKCKEVSFGHKGKIIYGKEEINNYTKISH